MTNRWTSWTAALLLGAPLFFEAQGLPPAPNGIAHVALRVSDLDAEVNFFGKLGFEKSFTDVGNNGRTMEVIIKVNDETYIQLYPITDSKQPVGFLHVSYEAPDLKALNARYVQAGVKPGPVQQDGVGDLWFNLVDPDGRPTEFTQYLSNSRQASDVGQHLGANRISDELMGFELPVKDMAASQKFYESLGFGADAGDTTTRLSLPGNPDMRIVLHPSRPGSQAQFLFPVDDARQISDELMKAGVRVERSPSYKLVFVYDIDGNAFVLLETGEHSPRHAKK